MVVSTKLFMTIAIALVLAFFTALSADKAKVSNDILAYSLHYECLDSSLSSIIGCQPVIGSPPDFLYQALAYSSKLVFGENGFEWFILFFSFLVYFIILHISAKYSPYYLITVIFMLTDFRFYELGNNVLRNGLALVVFMLVFYFYMRFSLKRNFVLNSLPVFAHITALAFAPITSQRLFLALYLVGLVVAIFLAFYFPLILNFIYDYFPLAVQHKINAYQMITNEKGNVSFSLPLHYFLVFIAGFYFLLKSRSHLFFLCFNIIYFLFLWSIVFDQFGVGYRLHNYSVPFIALLVAYYLFEIKKMLGFVFFAVSYFIVMVFFLMQFARNFDFIFRGF